MPDGMAAQHKTVILTSGLVRRRFDDPVFVTSFTAWLSAFLLSLRLVVFAGCGFGSTL